MITLLNYFVKVPRDKTWYLVANLDLCDYKLLCDGQLAEFIGWSQGASDLSSVPSPVGSYDQQSHFAWRCNDWVIGKKNRIYVPTSWESQKQNVGIQ